MDVIALQKIVAAHVDARIKGLEDTVGLIASRLPLLEKGGIGDQPCNTEFTTEGEGPQLTGDVTLQQIALIIAYFDAFNIARTICSSGSCTEPRFQRYAGVSTLRDPVTGNRYYKVAIVWKCLTLV